MFSHHCLPDGLCEMCSKRNTLILLPAGGYNGEIKSTFKEDSTVKTKGNLQSLFLVKFSYLTKLITPYSLKLLPISKKYGRHCLDNHRFISWPKHTDR